MAKSGAEKFQVAVDFLADDEEVDEGAAVCVWCWFRKKSALRCICGDSMLKVFVVDILLCCLYCCGCLGTEVVESL